MTRHPACFRPFFALLAVLVAFLGLALPAQAAWIVSLGTLPGGSQSYANGISGDGSAVVGYGNSASGVEAFVWTSETGMQGLGDLPGGSFNSAANGVSADGFTVVGKGAPAVSSNNLTFVWTSETGMQPVGNLPEGGFSSYIVANDVSADGSAIVGWGGSASGAEAFLWTSESGTQGLGDLPGGSYWSEATGVSADGSVVVGTGNTASGFGAFVWTSETGMQGLGTLPKGSSAGRYSHANGVSADGTTIVGSSHYVLTPASGTLSEGFVWTSEWGMVGLGDLPGGLFQSIAYDVSSDGSTVVGYSTSALTNEAFVWSSSTGMQTLKSLLLAENVDLTGWHLTAATGISDDGRRIAGYGDFYGRPQAFLIELSSTSAPVPLPSSIALLIGGLPGGCGLLYWRRRKAQHQRLAA